MRMTIFCLSLLALPIMAHAQSAKPQPISNQDCAAVFTHSDVSKHTRTPQDLLYVPAKIKAMRDQPDLSERVVNEVKAILALAASKVLKRDGRS